MPRSLNILWLSHFVPYPPKGGCFQRSYNLITRVAAEHRVHLVALRHKRRTHPDSEVENARHELLRHCTSVEIVDISSTTQPVGLALVAAGSLATLTPFNALVYRSQEVRKSLRHAVRRTTFDLAHFDTIGLAQYLQDLPSMPAVMTHHGAEAYMVQRRIDREPSALKRAFFQFEWRALKRYEGRWCPRFDGNIVMSADDGRLMSESAPGVKFTPVDNGVDTAYFTPVAELGRRTLVFAGRLDQYSNRDGLLYVVRDVWPRVRTLYPDAVFHVIGSNPPAELRTMAASDPQLRVHGFVPDVRPYFAGATATICPARDGGGTRIKVLDGLAQAVPVISTSVGCEGLDVVPEEHVLIADTPDAFVSQIRRVFDDHAFATAVGRRGRALAEARYSWNAQATKLLDVYETVVESRRTPMG